MGPADYFSSADLVWNEPEENMGSVTATSTFLGFLSVATVDCVGLTSVVFYNLILCTKNEIHDAS